MPQAVCGMCETMQKLNLEVVVSNPSLKLEENITA